MLLNMNLSANKKQLMRLFKLTCVKTYIKKKSILNILLNLIPPNSLKII